MPFSKKQVTLFFFALGLLLLLVFNNRPIPTNTPAITDAGQNLIYGIYNDAWVMPLCPVLDALYRYHFPDFLRRWLPAVILGSILLFGFSLGCLLHSWPCGIAVMLLSFCFLWSPDWIDIEQAVFTGSLLLVAAAMVMEVQYPSLKKNAAIGIAVALSLYIRSPLFLFPVVLVVFRAITSPQKWNILISRKTLLVLFIPPLMLIPWAFKNLIITGQPTFLESGRADLNMVAGALGILGTLEGNPYQFTGILPDQNLYLWAAREVFFHPVRYLAAVINRIMFAITLHPFLFITSLAGLWKFRRNRGFQLIGLLGGYFLVIHCLLGVEARYFFPLWFLLAVPAAASIDFLTKRFRKFRADNSALRIIWMVSTPYLAIFLLTLGLIILQSFRGHPPGMSHEGPVYEDLIRKHPQDAWLWNKLGKAHMNAGDLDRAIYAFGKALSIDPGLDKLDYLLAMVLRGNYGGFRLNGKKVELSDYSDLVLDILVALDRQNYEEVKHLLMESSDAGDINFNCWVRNAETDRELHLLEKCPRPEGIASRLNAILQYAPPDRKRKFVQGLNTALKEKSKFRTMQAVLGKTSKEKKKSDPQSKNLYAEPETKASFPAVFHPRILQNIRNMGEFRSRFFGLITFRRTSRTPWQKYSHNAPLHENALKLIARGKHERAIKVFNRLIAECPDNPVYLTDRGISKTILGMHSGAIDDFRAAIKKDPNFLSPYLNLGYVYHSMKEYQKEHDIYALALKRNKFQQAPPIYELIRKNYAESRDH